MKGKIFIIASFFLLYAAILNAQMHNYVPAANHQMQNIQSNATMAAMMSRQYYPAVQKHYFIITFTDSSTKTFFGKIEADSTQQYFVWVDRTLKKSDSNRIKKIYPFQTQCIALRADYGASGYKGIAADSCWLFKAIEGKITAYSSVADQELTTSYILYIQKDNGVLLPMNEKNLEPMLRGNEKALKFFDKGKYEKAILEYNKQAT